MTIRSPIVLAAALVVASCGYRPTLYGGADPEDAGVPGSAWVVVYSASCLHTCEATYTRDRDVRTASFEGPWQERVRIAQGSRGSVTLLVRPQGDAGVVRRAGIDVDGRRAARGEGGPGSPVTLTATLP